ncbi:hypothetical protein CYMTET_14076 [Cymbomonas tetramitiformis]|uniref:Uncharacterized protein n=1 Tax=Cymbomonas tetramitiformis TaxID=36881 RepID=A0AAE0LAR5_9CHLO|nr:hypothetical protein CYMTET_14076 [Cymbomonas tetramitiformis]
MLVELLTADSGFLEEFSDFAFGEGCLGPKMTLWGFLFIFSQYITTHLVEGDFNRADGQFDRNMLMSTLSSRLVCKGKHALQKREWSKEQLDMARGKVALKRERRKLMLDPDCILTGVIKALENVQQEEEANLEKKRKADEKAQQKEAARLVREADKVERQERAQVAREVKQSEDVARLVRADFKGSSSSEEVQTFSAQALWKAAPPAMHDLFAFNNQELIKRSTSVRTGTI